MLVTEPEIRIKWKDYFERLMNRNSKSEIYIKMTGSRGAEEDRLHEVALTAMKVANDPHLLSYPL